MSSETDLSTADLAQPGGSRQQDRADDEQGRGRPAGEGAGERAYETSGNRVADPGDQDTVELAPGGGSAGSTRDDAARGDAPYPGRSGLGTEDRDMTDRDMTDRDMTDRDMTDRDMTGQGMGDRDMTGQGMGDRDMAGQGMADRDMAGQGATGRDMADRDMPGQGMGDQGMGERGMGERGMGDRHTGDRGTADRGGDDTGGDVALLDPTDAEGFRRRWSDTQARFVDDPREAVQTADGLVAELMQTLASSFSQHKGELEAHWRSGGDPDTEDLRQALQRYRSFFDRLLSA
jgi:hypothetical protein